MTSPDAHNAHVERLTLVVPGLDDQSGRALARLVAAGLTPLLTRADAGIGLDHLRIEVEHPNGRGDADMAELARRIVDRLDDELNTRAAGAPR
jgi:hypothetical protein